MPRARELATKIAQHSPTALAKSKRVIWESLEKGFLPMGLANQVKLARPVPKDAVVTYADVVIDENLFSCQLRRAMEAETQKR